MDVLNLKDVLKISAIVFLHLIFFQFDSFLKIMNFTSNDNPNTAQSGSVFLKNLLHKDTKPLLRLDDAVYPLVNKELITIAMNFRLLGSHGMHDMQALNNI